MSWPEAFAVVVTPLGVLLGLAAMIWAIGYAKSFENESEPTETNKPD